jgi:hypothetical protein
VVHNEIWLVSFMDYGLGCFDLETRVLEPLENPSGPNPCLRAEPLAHGGAGEIRTPDLRFRKPTLYPSELQPPISDYYILITF